MNHYKNHIVVIEFAQKVNQRIDQHKTANSLLFKEEDLWVVVEDAEDAVVVEEKCQLNHNYIASNNIK
jgi:hypothetical protein